MVISMLKIRRPLGRLIFNMGIAIPGKTVFLIEAAPRKLIAHYLANTSIRLAEVYREVAESNMGMTPDWSK